MGGGVQGNDSLSSENWSYVQGFNLPRLGGLFIEAASLNVSPESCCRVGSIEILLHTSDNQQPTVSRTSLRRMEGMPL